MSSWKHILVVVLATVAQTPSIAQTLLEDREFTPLDKIKWGMKESEIVTITQKLGLLASSTDSTVVLRAPILRFPARTEIQFDSETGRMKLVQAKFDESTNALADSVTNYLVHMLGRAPARTVKEKSFIIFTLRMEWASWKLPSNGLVNLVTMKRGDSLLDASIVLVSPTAGK